MKRPRRPTKKTARKVVRRGVPILTNEMHDNLLYSGVGQFLDRLIVDEVSRGGSVDFPCRRGNVVQSIWAAFHTKRTYKKED